MSSNSARTKRTIDRLLQTGDVATLKTMLERVPPAEKELPGDIPQQRKWSADAWCERLEFLKSTTNADVPFLAGEQVFKNAEELRGNIENYIGMTQVPTGVIGPLRINGTEACGDFYVPMATTEGALVASYNRGAKAISLSGGVSAVCLVEAVQRAPAFEFKDLGEVGEFLMWLMPNIPQLHDVVALKTRHGKLEEIRTNINGNQISLILEFTTGDAAGQNMVTLAADAVCRHIVERCPVKPLQWYVEGNLSGDKKATAQSFVSVRGKKVTTEAVIRREIVESVLGTTPEKLMRCWLVSALNGVQSGSIGVTGHISNGLAAIFLACGQDVACVSEAAVGITRFDIKENGDLYVAVTLPNLIVGTVGGGTHLPTQRECLALIDCVGNGKARKFAEICAAAIVCGELSIAAALSAGDFARAHALYGRKRKH
ncbi:MAG: hydroxymethylglutaryl-CoA reductase [Bacteroidota bacterium]